MFGRIRSSSSLDSLERPPSKILKDDCLSIYEATLVKLKLGSQRESSPPTKEDALEDGETDTNSSSLSAEAMKTECYNNPASFPKGSHELADSPKEDLMTIDSDYSTASTTSTPEASEDCQSTEYSPQRRIRSSILYLFSKFKNPPAIQTIMEEMKAEDNNYCAAMLPSSSASQSTNNIELHLKQ
ncbi:uncharacterized protein LOC111008931 [Momordica charantia]|uniref:Uncharacterized protein LOC111008931 n=1 Tax=Momordica charantia TaxID=3673 RepID=A0A6J1C6T9_MOMCH|nr:uncharacterized protein LOC111008931 [Momordica charantia]